MIKLTSKTDTSNIIEISIRYNKERKYYYLSVQPLKEKFQDGFRIVEFMAFSGISKVLESNVKRFSDKKLQDYNNLLHHHTLGKQFYAEVLAKVAAQCELDLSDYSEVTK